MSKTQEGACVDSGASEIAAVALRLASRRLPEVTLAREAENLASLSSEVSITVAENGYKR